MASTYKVLVVGAGPVGLLSALLLKRKGIDVRLIDEHDAGDAHSFAIVLHARSVAMLADLGLVEPLVWQGHSFRRVAVFADSERRALLDLPVDGHLADGALTLPQDVLRRALEGALRAAGVEVDYGQRLLAIEQSGDAVSARVAVRDPAAEQGNSNEWRVARETFHAADFVIGSDGYDSSVRKALSIAMMKVGTPRRFGFFDVPHSPPSGAAVELALGPLSSASYPLHGGHTRYSFELGAPLPDRLGVQRLRELLAARMPWHSAVPDSVEWVGTREFQSGLAEAMGHGRVWLAGDACHATNPLGTQSLNIGLREARDLTEGIVEYLAHGRRDRLWRGYATQRHLEWRRLLGLDGAPVLGARTPVWAASYFEQLLTGLPAAGDDLDDLLAQLGVTLL
jgi:2-polyprenyl-6-methoxyphenol hydroxylase-like FAD-dependent oxidoreductase